MLRVSVVYAGESDQAEVALELPEGSTIADAVAASGLATRFPGIDIAAAGVGIWYRLREPHTLLSDGDRVEIYRPLKVDPKQARRERARR